MKRLCVGLICCLFIYKSLSRLMCFFIMINFRLTVDDAVHCLLPLDPAGKLMRNHTRTGWFEAWGEVEHSWGSSGEKIWVGWRSSVTHDPGVHSTRVYSLGVSQSALHLGLKHIKCIHRIKIYLHTCLLYLTIKTNMGTITSLTPETFWGLAHALLLSQSWMDGHVLYCM